MFADVVLFLQPPNDRVKHETRHNDESPNAENNGNTEHRKRDRSLWVRDLLAVAHGLANDVIWQVYVEACNHVRRTNGILDNSTLQECEAVVEPTSLRLISIDPVE
jgi:hypothetical protein